MKQREGMMKGLRTRVLAVIAGGVMVSCSFGGVATAAPYAKSVASRANVVAAKPAPVKKKAALAKKAAAARVAALKRLVPSDIRRAGVLTIATSAAFPPMNFLDADGKTVIGVAVDTTTAMAKVLGLKSNFVVSPFAGILTGIQAHRFDAGIIFADTVAREQVANVLDVFRTGDLFLANRSYSGPAKPACGTSIAAAAGSNEVTVLTALSKKNCENVGKPGYQIQQYPSNDDAALALASNRATLFITSAESGAYRVRNQPTSFKVVGSVFAQQFEGIALSKDSPQLLKALTGAFREVVRTKRYMAILRKWDVTNLAQVVPIVNLKLARR